jgi:hypothetical protein
VATVMSNSMLEGVSEEVSIRRLIKAVVDTHHLPDGDYKITKQSVTITGKVAQLEVDFYLGANEPVKHGTDVVGSGDVHIKVIANAILVSPKMNLNLQGMLGPIPVDGGVTYVVYGAFTPVSEILSESHDPKQVS